MTNLSPADYYRVLVGSDDAAGLTLSSTLTASTSLSAPVGLTATAQSWNTVSLAWQAVAGASSYQVDYSSNGGTSWSSGPSVQRPLRWSQPVDSQPRHHLHVQGLRLECIHVVDLVGIGTRDDANRTAGNSDYSTMGEHGRGREPDRGRGLGFRRARQTEQQRQS